jgi:uncharacterized membrane protein YiaA
MEWNISGLLGYFLISILAFIAVCIVSMLTASLILKIVYKQQDDIDGEKEYRNKKNLRLLISIGLILIFGILLRLFLENS